MEDSVQSRRWLNNQILQTEMAFLILLATFCSVLILPLSSFAGGGENWNDYTSQRQLQDIINYYNRARAAISELEYKHREQQLKIEELQKENEKLKKIIKEIKPSAILPKDGSNKK